MPLRPQGDVTKGGVAVIKTRRLQGSPCEVTLRPLRNSRHSAGAGVSKFGGRVPWGWQGPGSSWQGVDGGVMNLFCQYWENCRPGAAAATERRYLAGTMLTQGTSRRKSVGRSQSSPSFLPQPRSLPLCTLQRP